MNHDLRPEHLECRPDIDGLRAVAVLCIVVFHAFPEALKGGFIGVDIFFVISGFLISSIIGRQLARGHFSFADFYSRRVRRIFPALALVLAACCAAGWWIMLPGEYRQLGKHMAGGAGFVANYVLWGESGYFDNAAHGKPLLHLWSLGVEEQFYIVWPALLWLAWRRGISPLTVSMVLALASFGLNVHAVQDDPVRAFYAPQTRFWQILAGSVLASLPERGEGARPWLPALLAWLAPLGACMILAGLALITEARAIPGWWALLPTLGATLIIAAGAQAWLNRTLLSNRVLGWIGRISFPLYLWHWPLLVFAGLAGRGAPPVALRIGAVAAAFALASLTYLLLEQPIRSGGRRRLKTTVLVLLMAAAGGIGYDICRRDGLAFRMQERQAYTDYFENSPAQWRFFLRAGIPDKYHLECEFFDIAKYRAGRADMVPRRAIAESCYRRDPSRPHAVLLWGDSHVEQLSYGIRNHLPSGWQVLQVASSGCPPRPDASDASIVNHCERSNWFALQTIAVARPDVVVVAQNLGHTLAGMRRIADRLQGLGVPRVVFTGPVPHWTEELPKLMATGLWLTKPRRTFHGVDRELMAHNAALQAGFPKGGNAVFVNVMDFFCNQDGCLTYLGEDPRSGITTFDASHLMPQASDLLARDLLSRAITGN
ncbi:acyltransferase 3 [Janthinobacterium sp. HH01]|uniref:acyltransferase family protein n=1 Tax=Janthinobacterium sp. HH01 TaxID=1198452 RepID=UPI0002AE9C33|nr:acyltransferase family protein [Janthinobacterium sp. HH01]ELX12183.1 acyltransferase 3 [Janthinobacterium sp. HH01]